LLDAVQIILPKFKIEEDLSAINNEMESLNLSSNFIWFQQNSTNVFKYNVNDSEWILIQNKDNYLMSELYRVCITGQEEALITGKISH
jgi:hypothetical protein